MIRKVNVEDAIGEPLLHDITGILPDGFKGVMFKRNHIISEEDVDKLKNIGKFHIYVGDLEEYEVHEEDAICELVPHIIGKNLAYTEPSEGKINIKSKVRGILKIDSEGLEELNSVGDYTIATLPNYYPVDEGKKIAGARIVPLFTKREQVERAIDIAKKYFPIFEVCEYKKLKIGNIITGDEVYYGRIEDGFEKVLREKYAKYDAEVLGFTFCPDDLEKISEAVKFYLENDADLIIFTGGMSVDPDDLTPTAIRNTNAEMIVQGVPIQPGNMLTVGRLGDKYLIGVPGASLHSKITSFDIFLPRIFAGIELERRDFIKMGEGGLCQNCKVCTYPVCYFGD